MQHRTRTGNLMTHWKAGQLCARRRHVEIYIRKVSAPSRDRRNTRQSGFDALRVGLLTGAGDLHYAMGLTLALVERGISVDFIGSDQVNAPVLHESQFICFLNLRGDQLQAPAYLVRRCGC